MALTKVPSNLDATVATTQSASDNSTNVATTAYVTTAISNLSDSAPAALNTLNEIAAALGDDANYASTTTAAIAAKVPLAGGTMSGNLVVNAIVDADNFKINGGQGSDGQLLTSTGSGVAWEDAPAGGLSTSGGTLTGNLVVSTGSPQIQFQTGASHYNWQIAAQEAVNTAFEISSGAQDADATNDTYTPRLVILQSGNVGIGTTSPGATLHVDASGGANFKVSRTGVADMFYVEADGTNAVIRNPGSNDLVFQMGGTSEKMRIKGNGNVGIGETSPDSKLHLKNTASNAVVQTTWENDARAWSFGVHGGLSDAINLYDHGASASRFTVDTSGKVGIGTTAPPENLSVRAANSIIAAESTADSQRIGFQAKYIDHGTLYGSFEYTTGDAQLWIDNNFSGNNGLYSNIRFRNCPNGSSTIQDRMIIAGSTGNVGIGNIEASHKLHVEANGTGAISALRLANENTSVGDGAKLLFTSGASTTGAGIAGYGTALNTAHLIFYAGGDNERLRIHDDGRDFDFTSDTANDYTPRVNLYSKSSGAYCGEINFYSKHNANEWVAASIFATGGSGYGTGNPPSGGMRLYVRGEFGSTHGVSAVVIDADGTVNGDFNDTSDVALKKDVVSLSASDSLTAIKALNPVSFKWKLNDEARSGFIAQEVETHLPNDVIGEDWRAEVKGEEGDPSSRDEGSKGKAVNSTGILAHAVKVIQEQQKEIDALKARVTTLEG